MKIPEKSHSRLLLPLLLVAVLFASLLTATDAAADLNPDGDTSPWVTNDRVYAITQVGDVIFVGGQFTAVAPSNADAFTPRPYLAAFEADDGNLIASFAPTLDGDVRSLASSADGTQLFVGGAFTTVNGEARPAIVALDPATGNTLTNFAVTAPSGSTVYDIEADGDRVYLGGSFSNLSGVNTPRAARVDANTGDVDSIWRPRPNAVVEAISIPPNGDRVYLGGRFESIAGTPAGNLASVDTATGAFIEDFQADEDAGCDSSLRPPNGIRSIDTTNDRIFAMPYNNNCTFVFQPGQRTRVFQYDMDGDVQVVHLVGDRFFVGGHSAVVDGFPQNRMYAFNLDGTFDPTMTTESFGQPGVFAYYSSGPDLWVGGTIWAIGSTTAIRDLGRVGPAVGESIPTTPSGLTASTAGNSATLSWDASTDPQGIAGYRVLRGNEQLAFVAGATTSYTDVRYRDGEVNEYRVEAVDTNHNKSERSDAILVGLNGVSLASIGDQTSAIGDSIALTVSATAPGAVTFSATGLPEGLAIDPAGQISGIATVAGTFSTTVSATDGFETDSEAFAWTIVNDSISVGPDPQVRITTPIAGVVLEGGALTVSGVASDDSGVDNIRISVRNRSTGLYLQSDLTFAAGFNRLDASVGDAGSTISTYSLALSNLPEGAYTINALPTGVDGSQGEAVGVDITLVDSLGDNPYGVVQFPPARTNVYGAFSIIGTATDDVGISNVEILVKEKFPTNAGRRLQDDYTLDAAYNTFTASLSAPGESVTRFWLDLPAGLPTVNPWQVRVIVTDVNGNQYSDTAVNGFGIDGEYYAGRDAPTPYPIPNFGTGSALPPIVNITAPTTFVVAPNPVVIEGTASDNIAVETIIVRLRNDIGWFLQPSGTFASGVADIAAATGGLGTESATFVADLGTLPLGTYTADVIATDASGLSTTASRSITVQSDATGPGGIVIGAGITGDGFNIGSGSNLGPTRNILLSPTQFGPGAIYDIGSVSITDDVDNMTQAYLDGIDILFNGWVPDGDWSTGELDLVDSWVSAGGVLVATNDDTAHDALGARFGNPIVSTADAVWNSAGSHPITDGPFGLWTTISGSGNIGAYGNVAGWTVVARDTTGRPTIVTQPYGEGYIILVGDEGVFRTGIGGQNGIMASNLFAHAMNMVPGNMSTAPSITAIADRTDEFGTAVTLQVDASSPNGALTYTATGLPAGVTIDGTTGLIAGSVDAAGVFDVTVAATDTLALSVTASFQWAVNAPADLIEPDSVIIVPVSDSEVDPGFVTFAGTATDNASGVAEVRVPIRDRDAGLWVQADGTLATTVFLFDAILDAPGSSSTNWTVDVQLPNGRYATVPRAIDGAGNTEQDRSRSQFVVTDVLVDTVQPDTTVSAPTEGATVDVGLVSFSGDATDDVTGVSNVRLTVRDRDSSLWLQDDGTFGPDETLFEATLDSPGAASTGWLLALALPQGRYVVVPRAIDGAGNTEADRPRTNFEVAQAITDFVLPDSTITTPVANNTLPAGPVSFAGAATDDDSGVSAVQISVRELDTLLWLQADGTFAVDRHWVTTELSAPGELATNWSFDSSLPAGRYMVRARAIDAATNLEDDRPRVPFVVS